MEKTYKLSPEDREYFRNKRRESRLKDHKCSVCGADAYAKILLTKSYRCPKHLVQPLKEELTKQLQGNQQSQVKPPAPSAITPAIQESSV